MKRRPLVHADNCARPLDDSHTVCPPRKPGRPPRASKPSLERVEIRVTEAELLAWRRIARARRQTLSEWLRWCAEQQV